MMLQAPRGFHMYQRAFFTCDFSGAARFSYRPARFFLHVIFQAPRRFHMYQRVFFTYDFSGAARFSYLQALFVYI